MKLMFALISFAAGGLCTLMFLKRKPDTAKLLIPATLMPTQKRTARVRAHSHPAHQKRNGLKVHTAH